jgi:hypothetical protein
MLASLSRVLARLSYTQLVIVSLLIVLVLGICDYLTGSDLAFSIFYLPPIAIATWWGNRRAGVIVALFSAAIWLAAELLNAPSYARLLIPYWNTSVRFGFFLITLYLLAELRQKLELIETLAAQDPHRCL